MGIRSKSGIKSCTSLNILTFLLSLNNTELNCHVGHPGESRPNHHEHASPHREQRYKKGGDGQVSTMWLDNWTS